MDLLKARQRIRHILQSESELSESVADDVAFHLTDWLENLESLHSFIADPEKISDSDAEKVLMQFVIHVPNHLAAASKLWLDIPVTDVFDVGAIEESVDT